MSDIQQHKEEQFRHTSKMQLQSLSEDKSHLQAVQREIQQEKKRVEDNRNHLKNNHLEMLQKAETAKLVEQVSSMRKRQEEQRLVQHNINESLKKEQDYVDGLRRRQDMIEQKTRSYDKVASEKFLRASKEAEVFQNWQNDYDMRMKAKDELERYNRNQALKQIYEENQFIMDIKEQQRRIEKNLAEAQKDAMKEYSKRIAKEDLDNYNKKIEEQRMYSQTLHTQSYSKAEERDNERRLNDLDRKLHTSFNYIPGVNLDKSNMQRILDKNFSSSKSLRTDNAHLSPSADTYFSPFVHDPITNPIGGSKPCAAPALGKGRGIALLNAGSSITRPAI